MSASARRDLTQGSLTSGILRLAWPVTLGQMLMMAPSLYEALWLGQLRSAAQAAAGLTMAVRLVMISVLMALSVASGAVVARELGAGNQEGADRAALQSVILMVAAAGSLGVLGMVCARPLLMLAGADATTLPLAERYARIIFAGLIAIELVPSMGGMLSAAGAPEVMLGMTGCSVFTLLISEPFLVRAMGVEGAALGMVGSYAVGFAYGVAVLASARAPVRLSWRHLRLDFPVMGRVLRVALPAVLQRGAPNLAMALLLRIVSGYGSATLAGWVVAARVCDFAVIPAMGLARPAPVMVGQNLGAGQPERAARSVRVIACLAFGVSLLVFGLLAVLAPHTMRLMTRDVGSVAIGASIIRMVGLGYVALGLYTVFGGGLSGAGDTTSPMVINLAALWAVQIPLAFALSRMLGLGAQGIWIALVIGWLILGVYTRMIGENHC